MKNFKKVIAMSTVCGMMFCVLGANARQILDSQDVIIANVRRSVLELPCVQDKQTYSSKKSIILGICEERIEGLGQILIGGGIRREEVPDVIENYFENCGIEPDSYEERWLSVSENAADLRFNVESFQEAYRAVQHEFLHRTSKTHASKKRHKSRPPVQYTDVRPGKRERRRPRLR